MKSRNFKGKIFTICIVVLLNVRCNYDLGNDFRDEGRIISKYHDEMIKSKGDKYYFIPSEEVNYYFHETNRINVIENGASILFMDSIGNIIYQATVVNDKIDCLDLKERKHYKIDSLDVSLLRNFDTGKINEVRIYSNSID